MIEKERKEGGMMKKYVIQIYETREVDGRSELDSPAYSQEFYDLNISKIINFLNLPRKNRRKEKKEG